MDVGEWPQATAEQISRAAEHLGAWSALCTEKTRRNHHYDWRTFGRWAFFDPDPARALAWLLQLHPANATATVAAFDRAQSWTSRRETRRRVLKSIRGALTFAATRDGVPAPKIAPAVKDAA